MGILTSPQLGSGLLYKGSHKEKNMNASDIKDLLSSGKDIATGFKDLFAKENGVLVVFEELKRFFTETLKLDNLKALFDKNSANALSSAAQPVKKL